VSYVAQNIVLDHSRSRGASRLVFLALCRYIKHELWKEGEPAEAYPSQSTLARKCNCSRSTVERALEQLQALGEIHDTGERAKRSTVIYGLALLDEVRDGVHLTQDGAGQADMTHGESGDSCESVDLTHPANDLTHLDADLTDPAQNLTQDEAQDGCETVVKGGKKQGSSGALDFGATPSGIPPSAKEKAQRRAELQDLLSERDQLRLQYEENPKLVTKEAISLLDRELDALGVDPTPSDEELLPW
jgi:hypothetical protein